MTSWRRMTSRSRHGLGTAGPPRPLQADTPVTWVTKVINAVGYRTSNGRFPKRENRSLVLRSAAQRSGGERRFSASEKRGHRPRADRAGRFCQCLPGSLRDATTSSGHKRTRHTHKGRVRPCVCHSTLARPQPRCSTESALEVARVALTARTMTAVASQQQPSRPPGTPARFESSYFRTRPRVLLHM